jgi:arylsulfatase A-like enzyme
MRLAAFTVSLVCGLTLAASFSGVAQAQPNILVIVTDDQTLNGTMVMMPKTLKWFRDGDPGAGIAGGTEFTNFTVSTPLCCPSRSSIFTGRYAHNHGVEDNSPTTIEPGNPDYDPAAAAAYQNSTLQHYLQQAGYRTGLFGKYLNNWPVSANPPNFNDWSVLGTGVYGPTTVNEEGTTKWIWRYSPNYFAQQAEDFLQRAHDQNAAQPWFLYVAPNTPHAPYFPEPKYADASVPALDSSRSGYFEPDRRDKPWWVQQSGDVLNGDGSLNRDGNRTDEDWIRENWLDHQRMLKTADDLVDGVMQKLASLQAQGDDQDTLAVFMSDNGYLWGQHALQEKANPYLEAARVPFFVRWPGHGIGVAPRPQPDSLVANIDIAPTALAASGIDPNSLTPAVDGKSLIDTSGQRNRQLIEGWGADEPAPGVFPTWAAIRTSTFHYIESYETIRNPDGSVQKENLISQEYYDLVHDPGETTNLLADSNPRNDPPTAELSAELAADRHCSGSGCPSRENGPTNFPVATGITEKPDATSARNVTFSFSSTEPNSTFVCKLDREGWRSCAATQTYTRLRSGKHTLSVRAVGPGGNEGTSTSYTWKVDMSLDTRLVATPPPLANSTEVPSTFTFESPNASEFRCTLDTVPSTGGAVAPCTSPKTYPGLAGGTYKFTVQAVATATGKSDPNPPSYTWTVDATAPQTKVLPYSGICPGVTQPDVAVSCPTPVHTTSVTLYPYADESAERYHCKLDNGPETVCGNVKTYTGLVAGTHTVSVKATDFAGNTDSTAAALTWTVGTRESFDTASDPTWPQIVDGTKVDAIASDGAGGWYVGGSFNTVGFPGGAVSTHTNLVHIKTDTATNTHYVDDTWNPQVNGEVQTLVAFDDSDPGQQPDTLYIGGNFTGVKSTGAVTFSSRNRLAAIDVHAGSATFGQLTSWDPNVTISNPGVTASVNAIIVGRKTVSGAGVATLYAAGAFDSVHGVLRNNLVELPLSSDTPTSWAPSVGAGTYLYSLELTSVAPNLSIGDCAPGNCGYLYAGGNGFLREFDRGGTGAMTSWNPAPNGIVSALEIRAGTGGVALGPDSSWTSLTGGNRAPMGRHSTLFAGGIFTQIGNTAASRKGAAELNLVDDGSVTSWDPSLTLNGQPGAALAFVTFPCDKVFAGSSDSGYFPNPACSTIVGGSFDTAKGGTARKGLVETAWGSGDARDWNPKVGALADPNSAGVVNALACYPRSCVTGTAAGSVLNPARVLAVGGAFSTVGVDGQGTPVPRKGLAFFTGLDP